jgi:hypothetical protein
MITLPFISAWIVMVALGVIGHELDAPQYFVSYWFCFALFIVVTVPIWVIRYALESNIKE